MALDKAPLKSALQASMASFPETAALAAQGWADAISAHVATGQSPQGVPPTPASIAAGKPSMSSSIATAFQSGSASGAASGISSAVALFYAGLLFVGATPGVVSAVNGTAALGAALSSAFSENSANSATVSEAADRFADAIHACAQTVIVTHAPPSAVTGPLT